VINSHVALNAKFQNFRCESTLIRQCIRGGHTLHFSLLKPNKNIYFVFCPKTKTDYCGDFSAGSDVGEVAAVPLCSFKASSKVCWDIDEVILFLAAPYASLIFEDMLWK